jgi:NADH-quinone oxidoreductase subunit A
VNSSYVAILSSFGVAALVAGILLGAGALLRPSHPTRVKTEAFECGNPASGPAWGRFSVKFYLTAILFIVFDVEVVFLYPWAVMFRRLGMFGFVEMAVFVGVLALGFVYVWRKGALEWS